MALENLVSAERISQGILLDEVYLSTEHIVQLVSHIQKIPETPGDLGLEGNENIDIAVWAKVISQNGAKESKFLDFPLPAELSKPVFRDSDSMEIHNGLYAIYRHSSDFCALCPDNIRPSREGQRR
jgi:hypothetical protein